MKRQVARVRRLTAVAVVGFLGLVAVHLGWAAAAPQTDVEKRADLITIDTMKQFGPLERPAVVFMHDRHSETLARQNQDCTACHLSDKDKLSIKYQRLTDGTKNELMDLYHTNCLACHKKMAARNEKTGPVEECGACHKAQPDVASSWQPIGMDKSLHYRHSKSQDNKCERCHHEYDQVQKKLIYIKDQEGTCRYCHKDTAEDNRIALRDAAHQSCVACHRDAVAQSKNAGPVLCAGCHDAEQQQLIEVVADVPRMQRKQPDTVFVQKDRQNRYANLDAYLKPEMKRVPFDHKVHEAGNADCRTCHHAAMTACNTCHTMAGAKEGKGVKLQQAMHQVTADQSCLGCHSAKQQDKNCAGCHAFITKADQPEEAACLKCHMALPAAQGTSDPVNAAQAAKLLASARQGNDAVIADADIPETVTIKALSKKYGPAVLPHRKIVRSLEKSLQGNRLAAFFHGQPGTLCQGCHHNSPVSTKPPKCGSCHGAPFNAKDPFKPGLMAAYHRQCMGCHEQMQLAKPAALDCAGCHKKR